MADRRLDLTNVSMAHFRGLSDDAFKSELEGFLTILQVDTRENQLRYYKPASEKSRSVHFSRKKWVGLSGGNRSSKTDTVMAHIAMQATGVWPSEQNDPELHAEMLAQFRGPINCRIVVESFTTTLYPTILPKLKYYEWLGMNPRGGDKGHWGWIPKHCLLDGSWEKSWTDKIKTLTFKCFDPENGHFLGNSNIQMMSKDQDSEDFASGSFHIILHDEPPYHAQWIENQARTMDVNGRIFLAFTWPDDPTIPIDWVYEELYDKAGDDNHDWFELWTTDNRNIDQDSVALQAGDWSEETKRVRLYGGSMRFSNRIHPLFTDIESIWCLTCRQPAFLSGSLCSQCGSDNHVSFCHVQEFEYGHWPCVFLLDPHPRKPHMFCWVEVTPADDFRVIQCGEIDDTPVAMAEYVFNIEEEMGLFVPLRLIDPNMGHSLSSSNRETLWQDEFDACGLWCTPAENTSVGRKRIDEYLKVDEYTQTPRLIVHSRCSPVIHQMKRYVWDDFKRAQEKDVKQVPRTKYDDYPSLLKYLMNQNVDFRSLNEGFEVITRPGTRRGAY